MVMFMVLLEEVENAGAITAADVDRLSEYSRLVNAGAPLTSLLPLLFQLKSKPYSLDWSHFMFEPMYNYADMPRQMLWRTGRQVSKSTNLACSQVLLAALTPHLNLMTVMPLQEQVRKFSANYVKPFITTSPFRSVMLEGGASTDAVLQRRVGTSNLFYMYGAGNTNRLRGIPADALFLDEVQDLDHSDLPIMEANLSASPWKLMRFTGTPKTFDNTIQLLWEDSSQAHWHIPCTKCGHVNRAAADGDLIKMIGKYTLVCAKCSTDDLPVPIDSRAGYWVHDFGERMLTFPGYHVPQPILPMHYASPRDWQVLLDFQRTKPKYAFYNEILGEPYDAGSKLVTREELINACQAEPCRPETMPSGEYVAQCLGVDWGGRGKERTSDAEDFISNTAFALAGLRSDSRVEIKWLHKVSYEVDMSHETEMAVNVAVQSHTTHIALDYGGQGNVQEQQLRAHGWPQHAIMPFTYTVMTPNKPIVFFNATKKPGVRVSLMLDKPRSLLLLCELVKRGWVILPKNEEWMNNHLLDFMNIYEESMDNPNGSPRRLVKRMSRRTDDVVHAINFAVMGLFRMTSAWPQITAAFVTGWNTETNEVDPEE